MSGRSKSSSRWLQEHFSDPFVKRAKKQGLRSRAVFKLEEIVLALEHEKDLKSLFLDRIRQTVTEKNPFG